MTKRSVSHKHGHRSEKAYTRKEYIRRFGTGSRIAKFTVGKTGDYTHELTLIALKERMIPEVVLESVRLVLVSQLRKIKDGQFVFRIMPYPHHVLRENKILGTAKAERIQEGMRRAFGKPIGMRGARVKKNSPLVKVWVHEKNIPTGREALRVASRKMGVITKTTITKTEESPRIKPKKEEEPVVERKVYKGR